MIKFNPENLLVRPWRLVMITIILALAFVYGRLILFSILAVVLFVTAIKSYITSRKSYVGIIIPVIIIVITSGLYFIIDYHRVISFMKDHSPIDLELVRDGTYEGVELGLRGPIKTRVTIEDGILLNIDIIQHQEAISALNGLPEQLIMKNDMGAALVPATIHGSIEATEGFRASVADALWKGIPEKPEFSIVTKILHYFSKFRLDMTTFNTLAILFCIALVFDYTLQPVLIRGTGQALNCYNCQTCVGVCPVKIIDGEPYPMTMILAARLGDYEKVKYLSKYCVACSRCAGKCPVGDSGPSIAAAANAELLKKRKRSQVTV